MNLTAPWRLLHVVYSSVSRLGLYKAQQLQPISICLFLDKVSHARTSKVTPSPSFHLASSLYSRQPLSPFFFLHASIRSRNCTSTHTYAQRRTHNNALTHIHMHTFFFSHLFIRISHQHRFALRVLHTRYLSFPLCHHPFNHAFSMKIKQYYYY